MFEGEEQVIDVGGGDAGGSVTETSEASEFISLEEPEVETGEIKTEGAEGKDEGEQQESQDKDTDDYKALASGRIRGLVKKAPELAAAFKAHPEIQGTIEKIFRRESAFSEFFPSIAEARELRERLPNGVQDLNSLVEETQVLETIDNLFYGKGQDGAYQGHSQMIKNFFEDDKDASRSLFKTIAKEWPTYDREGYNEVMGKIVGATFLAREIPQLLDDIVDSLGENPDPVVVKGLQKLQNFVASYTTERKRTAQDEQLDRERADRQRESSERSRADTATFNNNFRTNNVRIASEQLNKHPVIVKLQSVKSVTADKKNDILTQIRRNTASFLEKSPAFMRKLKAAYDARNMAEVEKVVRSAWSQPWLLNRMIRDVLRKETPQLVSTNREAAAKRAGAQRQQQKPANNQRQDAKTASKPTKPYQIGSQWYFPSGQRMTAADVLAGKHQTQGA